MKQYDYLFKIVLIGNSSVGKSSLLRKYTDDIFQQSYLATIGVDFKFKSLNIQQNLIKLQIWDTAGQQRFRTITSAYYKGAHAIIIMFDLTNKQSFQDLQLYWFLQVDKYSQKLSQKVLVGCKSDLQYQVSKEKINAYANKKNVKYFQVCSKNGQNVSAVFQQTAMNLIKKYPKIQQNDQFKERILADVIKKRKQLKLKSIKNSTNQLKCCK